MSPPRRRPPLLPAVAALLGLALTVSASVWQYGRGRDKDRIAAAVASANASAVMTLGAIPVAESAARYRRVRADGEFVAGSLVLQDNRSRGATPGYEVFMALRIAGGAMHVLVKRGWVAGNLDRGRLPDIVTPSGAVEIEGIALPPNARFLELSQGSMSGTVWQNVTLERFAAHFPQPLQPFLLEQHSDLADGLARDWLPPANGSARHYGYAFQWGAMATLIVVLYGYFLIHRFRSSPPTA